MNYFVTTGRFCLYKMPPPTLSHNRYNNIVPNTAARVAKGILAIEIEDNCNNATFNTIHVNKTIINNNKKLSRRVGIYFFNIGTIRNPI